MRPSILVPFLFSVSSMAQGLSTVKGRVIDYETGGPMAGVVIDMQYGGYASSSNSAGQYIFNFPTIVEDSEIVAFSAIGYESQYFVARQLFDTAKAEIKLKRAAPLDVKLGLSEARNLVQSAVDSIKINYRNTSFFQNGFYQETAEIESIGYVKIKEAMLRVERFPDQKKQPDKIKSIKSRWVDWFGQSAKLEAWQFINGPAVACRSIETELPNFMTRRGLKSYDFTVDSMLVNYKDKRLYVVNFEPKSKNLSGGRTGKIFIEPTRKAIVRLEYELTKKGLNAVIGNGMGRVKLKGESLKFISQYRWDKDKWILHENKMTVDLTYLDKLDNRFEAVTHWELRFLSTESREISSSMIEETDVLLNTDDFRRANGLGASYWGNRNHLMASPEMEKIAENRRRR